MSVIENSAVSGGAEGNISHVGIIEIDQSIVSGVAETKRDTIDIT